MNTTTALPPTGDASATAPGSRRSTRRAPWRGAQHAERAGRDGGYSLLEILVSLSLMGTVMAAVMAAMFSAIHASSITDNAADLDAALGATADAFGEALFVPCPENVTPNAYQQYADVGADVHGWPAGTVSIIDVKYWDPLAAPADAWVDANGISGTECDETVWLSTAKTMQKVIVQATTPDGADSRILEIVVTDVRPES
ncbi:MAG: prepilin-type N-terminal cleavage/methylation domain-containing protein [Ilumatobacter sp.]|nr:prepilin-type N-terminal cleavage/methylation domain-containing protein [Ilumatobacter sp.]